MTLVSGCVTGPNHKHLLAEYPDHPLLFEHICSGFQQALMGGN